VILDNPTALPNVDRPEGGGQLSSTNNTPLVLCRNNFTCVQIPDPNGQAMAVEASAIHADWQACNSYRTRYKVMKSENGEPVRDISSYISQKEIPPEYRGYYRQNTQGCYEEDIKKIPNEWLAANNARENLEGARSYIQHLRTFVDAATACQQDLRGALVKTLSDIHADWYNRNSSWTVSSGVPPTFQDSDIETRYNGARQLFGIAERHGVLTDSTLREAFAGVLQELREEKFAPFSNLSIEGAFLALTHKTGVKPAITGDRHVEEFFDEKMPEYPYEAATDREQEVSTLLPFIKGTFPNIAGVPCENFEFISPPIPPGSGARVYLIKDSGSSTIIAALKVQEGSAGLDEIASTLAAGEEILTDEHFRPVKSLSFGKLGKTGDFFILQEAAKTFEADKTFSGSHDQRLEMTERVGSSLATLHGKFRVWSDPELGVISADLTTFRGNCFYDIRRFNGFLPSGKYDIFQTNDGAGEPYSRDSSEVALKLERLSKRYSDIVELTPHHLSPAITHGDFHGGNIFLTSNSPDSRMIDFGGASWFIGKKIGTGDRGNDVGRMVGNILVEGTRYSLDFEREIEPLIDKLISTYKSQAGLPPNGPEAESFDVSVHFYASRFFAINLADKTGVKFKPLGSEDQEALSVRLRENWSTFLKDLV